MRLAGTCSRYSKSAMPQLASAAIHQGFAERLRRCAYQAKVMKTLDAASSAAVSAIVELRVKGAFPPPGAVTERGIAGPRRGPGCALAALSRAAARARTPARASSDAVRPARAGRSARRR